MNRYIKGFDRWLLRISSLAIARLQRTKKMTVWMQNVGKTSFHLNNQKSESERGQNTAISTQTAISFMRMLSTILPGVLNMRCCPWGVSTCICLQPLLFDNYENESFLTCPVLSDSLLVTLTFSKVITWEKHQKSSSAKKSFQMNFWRGLVKNAQFLMTTVIKNFE